VTISAARRFASASARRSPRSSAIAASSFRLREPHGSHGATEGQPLSNVVPSHDARAIEERREVLDRRLGVLEVSLGVHPNRGVRELLPQPHLGHGDTELVDRVLRFFVVCHLGPSRSDTGTLARRSAVALPRDGRVRGSATE
jgi:hypothetical protein